MQNDSIRLRIMSRYGNNIKDENLLVDNVRIKKNKRRYIFTPITEAHELSKSFSHYVCREFIACFTSICAAIVDKYEGFSLL